MKILKSISAVLAGIIFIGVTHSVTDLILEKAGIFTPPDQRFDTTWKTRYVSNNLRFR